MPTYKGKLKVSTNAGGTSCVVTWWLDPSPPFISVTSPELVVPPGGSVENAIIAWAGSDVTVTTVAGPPETVQTVTK